MGILGILFLILVLIAFGVFIYLMVKTAHGWGALHTTSLFFLFFSTLVYLFSAAGVASRRIPWVKSHDKHRDLLENLLKDETKLKYGDLNSTAQDNEALIPAIAHLTRLTSDRGRVWKGGTLRDIKADTYELQFMPANAAANLAGQAPGAQGAPAAQPATDKVIDEGLVVYAFAENADPTGKFVPVAYLGEFIVDKSAGTGAFLKPTAPLLPQQRKYIADGMASRWSVFELMPLDSHEVFAAEGSQGSENEYFGRMDKQQIAQALAGAGLDTPRGQKLLESYLADGSAAPDNVNAENLWILVEFVKDHTIDVDSKEKRNATDGGFFDPIGRTVDERLKRGGDLADVKYAPGDKRLLWKAAAEELISLGVAKPIKRIYVRPLTNYANAFRDVRQGILSTIQQIELLKRENDIAKQTNQLGQEQLGFRQEESQKLDKDLAQVTKEQAVAQKEVQRLESELASLQQKITASFQRLQAVHSDLINSGGLAVPVAAP